MWIFLMVILGLTMFLMLGDIVRGVPQLAWLFPDKPPAQALPPGWMLELAPGGKPGEGAWRLTLPGKADRAGPAPKLVLTCLDAKLTAHLDPGTEVVYRNVQGTAKTPLVFDHTIKREWEQGKGNLLFPPNSVWFVEKALASRDVLHVAVPLPDQQQMQIDFVLSGLELYRALLANCGVNLPVTSAPQPRNDSPNGRT